MLPGFLRSHFVISLLIFIVALLPRLLDPDQFLTPDEFLWIDRSRNFLAGLLDPAYQCTSVVEKWNFVAEGLACTLRTGHPGVTTMWTGSLGLWLSWLANSRYIGLPDYLATVSTNPLDVTLIAPARIGTILITALWVVIVYWLARRLFGSQIALVGALLLALDPFHIALSRVIHHDALSTTFMTLAVLAAFIYWGQGSSKKWLLISGGLAGLAILSKSPALFLLPFIAVVGLWFLGKEIRGRSKEDGARKAYWSLVRETVLDGLLWFGVAVAVVFVFWPAMWVTPLEAMETVFFIGSKYATGGHAKGNFFLGEISNDPGPLFYPVTWLYRTSPLVMLGVIAALGLWPWRKRIGKEASLSQSSGSPVMEPIVASGVYGVEPLGGGPAEASTPSPAFNFFSYLPLLLIFILGYYLLMTVGEKKQDRYFLPVYPWLNLIAAAGLVSIIHLPFRSFVRRSPSHPSTPPALSHSPELFTQYPLPSSPSSSELLNDSRNFSPTDRNDRWYKFFRWTTLRFTFYPQGASGSVLRLPLLLLLILTLHGYFVASHFPYYFTYYNPVLGGIQGAAHAVTIGWGEGLDLAAAYLNQQFGASRRRVASWYESTFAPYYYGPAISYSKEKGKVLAGDYAIFYINQTQRRFPDDILFEYIERRFEPVHVVTLHGLEYAWIYPSLGIDHYIQDQTYTGIASLLAWQWTLGDRPFKPGEDIQFELYWEYLSKKQDEAFFFRLVDAQNRPWAEGLSQPVGNPPAEQWREGEIIYETGVLRVPSGMPPGQYQLQIGFYTSAPAVTSGELLFVTPPEESLITVDHGAPFSVNLPINAVETWENLDRSLTLIGTVLPQEPLPPGANVPIELFWQVNQALPANAELHVGLMDEAGQAKQAWFNLSLAETLNPDQTTWQPGDVIHTRWQLQLLPEVTPGRYHFDLVWPADPQQVLPFGRLDIQE